MAPPPAYPTKVIQTRVREQVAQTVRDLLLPGVPDVRCVFRFVRGQITLPVVVVSADGLAETEGANSTNEQDEVGYPCKVSVVANLGDPPDQSRLAEFDLWRAAIRVAFHNRPLKGVPESTVCEVEPSPPGEEPGEVGLYTTAQVVRCYCRVPVRTLV